MESRLPPTSDQTPALWRRYRATGDPALRDRLVLTFAPLVKYIVNKKLRQIPARHDVEDFISCGLEALIRSIDRYEPERGATFEQYAWIRVHGAVADELRRRDWVPRSVRRTGRQIATAREDFIALYHRRPTTEELAEMTGLETSEVLRGAHADAVGEIGSLNDLVKLDDHASIERIATIPCRDRDRDPEDAATRAIAAERLRAALAMVSERERVVAVLLHVAGLTQREAAGVLGVSESRICQIHRELCERLRRMLADDSLLFAGLAA